MATLTLSTTAGDCTGDTSPSFTATNAWLGLGKTAGADAVNDTSNMDAGLLGIFITYTRAG